MATTQFCNDTFEVFQDETRLGVYIYKQPIGGGDHLYYVKRGEAADHVKGETISKGFDTRKQALAWIEKNVN
jgi:hypothetical protein